MWYYQCSNGCLIASFELATYIIWHLNWISKSMSINYCQYRCKTETKCKKDYVCRSSLTKSIIKCWWWEQLGLCCRPGRLCISKSIGGVKYQPNISKSMHYGASNEIKEIKVCKKCPKVNPLLRGHFWSNYVQTFFGWCKMTPICCQIFFCVKTSVKY